MAKQANVKSFTFYIIAEEDGTHRPVIMSRNGKQALNEACANADDVQETWRNFRTWINIDTRDSMHTMPVEITRAEFMRKYANGGARNVGGRKRAKLDGAPELPLKRGKNGTAKKKK